MFLEKNCCEDAELIYGNVSTNTWCEKSILNLRRERRKVGSNEYYNHNGYL